MNDEANDALVNAIWDISDGITTYDPSRFPTKSFYWQGEYKRQLELREQQKEAGE